MATISKKEEKYCFKKTFLKWDCSDDFIADFGTDGDIILLKCEICRKHTVQIWTKAWLHNLRDPILDSILSYLDGKTYVHKANVYNHVKAGGLHDWAQKKNRNGLIVGVWMYPDWIRSSHLKYFMKKGVLKYFAKFTLVYARVSFLSSGLRQLLLWLNTVSIRKQNSLLMFVQCWY